MKRAMKLSAGDTVCLPLPRLAGEGGPAGPGEGVVLFGAKRPKFQRVWVSRPFRGSCGASRRREQRPLLPLPGHPPPPSGGGESKRRCGSTAEAQEEGGYGLSKPCPERLKFLINQENIYRHCRAKTGVAPVKTVSCRNGRARRRQGDLPPNPERRTVCGTLVRNSAAAEKREYLSAAAVQRVPHTVRHGTGAGHLS
jgi:hypothetical protein